MCYKDCPDGYTKYGGDCIMKVNYGIAVYYFVIFSGYVFFVLTYRFSLLVIISMILGFIRCCHEYNPEEKEARECVQDCRIPAPPLGQTYLIFACAIFVPMTLAILSLYEDL